MSEYRSETSDIIKSEPISISCIDSDSIFQEPPKKKIKVESDDGTQYGSAGQPTTDEAHKFNLVPDTEPANYMTYLLNLPQEPDVKPKELVEGSSIWSEIVVKSPLPSDSDSEDTAEIVPMKHSEAEEENVLLENTIEITIDGKYCVLDLQIAQDLLAVLHEMYPEEKEAVVYARNEWGELILGRCSMSTTTQESQLQECFQGWLKWHIKKNVPGQSPLCYKCYICNNAWWTLNEFRNHIVKHPNCYLEHEILARECNIVAYEVMPIPRQIRIYKDCYKCGRNYDHHMTSKGQRFKNYACDYCGNFYVSCTTVSQHMSSCPDNPMVRYNHLGITCQVCQAPFYTETQLTKHLSIFHRVRSDEPIASWPKTCDLCDQVYSMMKYHVCCMKEFKHICMYCYRKFQCIMSLTNHLLSCKEPVQCPNCDFNMPSKCSLREHYIKFHCKNFLLVYVCPLCINLNIFLSLGAAEYHMEVEHPGELYSTIVMAKVMLQAWLQSEYDVQLPVKIAEVKSLLVSESSNRTQNRSRIDRLDGHSMKPVKVYYAPTLPFGKDKQNQPAARKKANIAPLENVTKKEIDQEDRSEQLNEHALDSIKHISDIKTETSQDSESNNDGEIISDDDDTKTEINTESVMSKVLQEQSTEELRKYSELDNDDGEIISDSNSDDFDTGTAGHSGSDMSEVYEERTEKVTEDSESEDDTVIIIVSKSTDTDIDTVRRLKTGISKVIQEVTSKNETNDFNSDDDVEIISDSKSVDSHIHTVGHVKTGISELLPEETTNVIKDTDSDEDVIETIENESKVVKNDDVIEKESNLPKVLQDPTKYAEDKEEKNSELSEGANLLKTESAALVKGTDSLIVLDSTDSDEDNYVHQNQFDPTLDVKKQELLKTGLKRRKTDYHKDCHCPAMETRYKCSRCKAGFPYIRKYVKHLKKHGYDLTCPQCNTTYANNSNLWRHIMVHIKSQLVPRHVLSDKELHQKEYQCRNCDAASDKTYVNFVNWEKHLRFKEEPRRSLVQFRAGLTTKQALKSAAVRELIAILQGKPSKKCSLCLKPIKDLSGINHLVDHLLEDAIANTADNKLKCQICSDLHRHPDSYKAHMREHSPHCKICNEVFNTAEELAEHELTHLWSCKYCLKKFKHLEPHHCPDRIEPTGCPLCGKLFESKPLIDAHVRYAHKARCLLCSMAFVTIKEKNQHLLDVHKQSPTRPYTRHVRKQQRTYTKCPLCKQIFRTYTNVKIHLNNYHGRTCLDGLKFQIIPHYNLRRGTQDDLQHHSAERLLDEGLPQGSPQTDTEKNLEESVDSRDEINIESRGDGKCENDNGVLDLESSDEESILLNDGSSVVLTSY